MVQRVAARGGSQKDLAEDDVFEMHMQFETDEDHNPLSEVKIIADMNESGRALEVLFEACENAKVLTRIAQDE